MPVLLPSCPEKKFVGKRFRMFNNAKTVYTIVDIHVTKNLAGTVIERYYVAEHTAVNGQVLRGQLPLSTLYRSIERHGWVAE